MTYDVDEYLELRDALIAAVRAECAEGQCVNQRVFVPNTTQQAK